MIVGYFSLSFSPSLSLSILAFCEMSLKSVSDKGSPANDETSREAANLKPAMEQ